MKVIRSICLFNDRPTTNDLSRLSELADKFKNIGFEIQTKRICSSNAKIIYDLDRSNDGTLYSLGELDYGVARKDLDKLLKTNNVSFNVNLTSSDISVKHTDLITEIIKRAPRQTFNFTYTFNNSPSSPYFPSAVYVKNGFTIGLQPTNLSENCETLEQWFEEMSLVWNEITDISSIEPDFLGIDTSIAPIFDGSGSLVNFIKRLGMDFSSSVTTDTYLRITDFIKNKSPQPIGLCGLMFPCLEDFELADEYEKGNFSIERNMFLALHSGLGIDTYPIGIDEHPQRAVEVLRLVQGISNKYRKSLSVRFVSDGKAKVGQKTNFKNQYLKDVVVRAL
ncbi:TPA: hypothetical protein DIS56_02030 [Candidatus Saccharibacteria bacterium]|nr:MAG: hypothetical protein UX30_C0006G0060 [Candidatus Saccharibacteria bacterium GW2011_GWA2_46_10]OGL35134.1 MAG: hypothetical protein A3F05_03565 [Candidatus Saccharibacteria bacterium RIFCSPHIGHO2_12_FULL_47_17]HCM51889.1 hypothetical protein [Candidatus Saccharibacteria bacterium]